MLWVEDENVDVEWDSELASESSSKDNNTVMCMGNCRQSLDWRLDLLTTSIHDS
jgi:hypothetical protein